MERTVHEGPARADEAFAGLATVIDAAGLAEPVEVFLAGGPKLYAEVFEFVAWLWWAAMWG
ncbi:MAG: hypothetical protein P4L85_19570 [Paludisphaera borealis]|uniref:hypothetical protein n=1 Tax=Paludisphaera borealis TaxID=1387353 RepID=UPI00284E098D|nr:hypothetical protein [Paludisphaera borealis]MDR3621560.1 hypothetical protein [Paludisphaera borealis]